MLNDNLPVNANIFALLYQGVQGVIMNNAAQSAIRLAPGLLLDLRPTHGESAAFQSFEKSLRHLQVAIGNTMVMSELRRILPKYLAGPHVDDHQVLKHIAAKVAQGTAVIKPEPQTQKKLPMDDIVKDLERFEGNVPHMYVDTKGYVTVGVGKMLPSAAEAQKLPFIVRSTKAPATPAQIASDFEGVHAQPKGQNWRNYKSDLDLPQPTIDGLTQKIAENCSNEVKERYVGYDRYPTEVKRVLIDMRFNMGGNMDKFKNFKKNIELASRTNAGKDWEAAAKESHRKDVQPDRNDWAYNMILKGGGVKK